MNYYFITGISSGIGKALCEKILQDTSNRIAGISRSNNINHPNLNWIKFDLAESEMIPGASENFFDVESNPNKLVLINNAATLGEVGAFGSLSDQSLIDLFKVNVIAPALLMNIFIKKFKNHEAEKIILNISSGAASRPMDGWGGYCSSKAALNMMSDVAALENNLLNKDIKIFALAPGVVDTKMQDQIRKASKENFSEIERFIKLKNDGELSDPAKTAAKILFLIENASKYKGVVQDVRRF